MVYTACLIYAPNKLYLEMAPFGSYIYMESMCKGFNMLRLKYITSKTIITKISFCTSSLILSIVFILFYIIKYITV